jgi:hypothetical protein
VALLFLLNYKFPVYDLILFCYNPVKINAGREIISLEFNFVAGEMFRKVSSKFKVQSSKRGNENTLANSQSAEAKNDSAKRIPAIRKGRMTILKGIPAIR